MKTVGIRDLQRNVSAEVEHVEKSGRPTLVTRRGRPSAILLPIDEDALEEHILANAPDFVTSLEEAEDEFRGGETRSAQEVLAELESGGT